MSGKNRVPGMTAAWPPRRRRKSSMVIVETPYRCTSCGELWVHNELMPEWDEPHGLDEHDTPSCECGGRLVEVGRGDV